MSEKESLDKLNLAITRLKDFPDLFELKSQKCKNIFQFFNKFKCTYLPNDFIEFMKILDGLHTEIFTIFSIEGEKNRLVMTFDEYSKEEKVNEYMSLINKKFDSKFFFFGLENGVGRYAFKVDSKDTRVYYFNAFEPDKVVIYNSFLDVLNGKINEYIDYRL